VLLLLLLEYNKNKVFNFATFVFHQKYKVLWYYFDKDADGVTANNREV